MNRSQIESFVVFICVLLVMQVNVPRLLEARDDFNEGRQEEAIKKLLYTLASSVVAILVILKRAQAFDRRRPAAAPVARATPEVGPQIPPEAGRAPATPGRRWP